jgi:hypothetical protein
MAHIFADRVKETTATTGTGTLTLAGAVQQFQTFAAVGDGNTGDYCLLSGNGTDWETGKGTYTAAGTTWSRDTVYASSNAGAKINLTGTSTIFVDYTAFRANRNGLYSQVMSATPTSAGTGLTTWLNQGGATVNDRATGITISAPSNAGDALRGRTMAVPGATPYSFKALIGVDPDVSAASNYTVVGLGWYDGSAKLHIINLNYDTTLGFKVQVARWTNVTTFSASDVAPRFFAANPGWVRIRDDGTTVYFQTSVSGDDNDFTTLYSVAKASGFLGASGYSNIVLFVNRTGTSGSLPANGTLFSFEQGS